MNTTTKMLAIKQGRETLFVKQSSIVYCKVQNTKITIYFEDGSTCILFLALSKLFTLLDNACFGMSHPAYIVNANFISKIQYKAYSYEIVLKNSEIIPLANSKRKAIIALITESEIHGTLKNLL